MRKIGLFLGVMVIATAGCGDDGGGGGGGSDAGPLPGPATVGPAGGTVVSSDGRARLVIPAGALSAETEIRIEPTTVAANSGFEPSLAYRFEPDGLTFALPARLSLTYDEAALSQPPAGLRIAKVEEGYVGGFDDNREIDLAAKTVSADLTGFSSHAGTFCVVYQCLNAIYSVSPRQVVVSFNGTGTLDEAACDFPCAVTAAELVNPPSRITFGPSYTGAHAIPAGAGGVRWFRLTRPKRVDMVHVVFFGTAHAPPVPQYGLHATPQSDGSILVEWWSVHWPGVTYQLYREICGQRSHIGDVVDGAVANQGGFSLIDSEPNLPVGTPIAYYLSARNADGTSAEAYTSTTARPRAGQCALMLYTCEVQAPGAVSLTVTPPPAGGRFALSLEDRGASRLAGFATATFSPAVTEASSRLDFTPENGASGERWVDVVAHDPASGARCHAPLRVRAGTVNIDVRVLGPDGSQYTPNWIAGKPEGGAWRPLPLMAGMHRMESTTGRYTIAVGCSFGRGALFEGTTDEVRAPVLTCPQNEDAFQVNGSITSPTGGCYEISLGRSVAGCYPNSWAAYVRNGLHDHIILNRAAVGAPVTAARIDRDVAISGGPAPMVLNVVGNNLSPATSGTLNVTGAPVSKAVTLFTRGGRAQLAAATGTASALVYGSPALGGDDRLLLLASDSSVTASQWVRTAGTHSVDLTSPPSFPRPVLTWSNGRPSFALAPPTGVDLMRFDLMGSADGGELFSRWFVWVTPMAAGSSWSFPDLTGAPGYSSDYAMGMSMFNWSATADVASGDIAQMIAAATLQPGAVPDGFRVQSVRHTGN